MPKSRSTLLLKTMKRGGPCRMIKLHLVLRTGPLNSWLAHFVVYIEFPTSHWHMSSGYQTVKLDVNMFQYFTINRVFQVNLEVSSVTQLHNTSWWHLTGQWTLASQGSLVFYEHCSHMKGEKILDYSYAGHWTSRKHNRNMPGCIFPCFLPENASGICFVHLYASCYVITPPSGRAYHQLHCVKFWSKSNKQFLRYSNFCILPLSFFSQSDHFQSPSTWDMASELTPMPQQLITQSAQATADAIASVLTARMASISLPIYDWNSQDAYHSFSIFCCTLENWLLLNCILPDSKDHLRYIFAALGTKSLEMHAQWMPTASEEEQKATKVKASAFLDRIQQGMTHNVNTHVHLGEFKDIMARLGENPQDLIICIKTLMDQCKMINDEHREHELCCCIVHAYHHEGKLLGKLMAKPFKTPSSELADFAVNHFAIQHAQEQVSHSSKPVDTICQDKRQTVHTSHKVMVTHHQHHLRTVPTAHNSTQSAEQTTQHMIPIVPNATRWDTGDQNAMVASHSYQGMHLHQGHSRGSPDAHLGTTTTAKGGTTKQTP